MNLTISGHHLEVTPAIRDYVSEKLDRVKRHFDQVINVTVIMQVENWCIKWKPPCTSRDMIFMPIVKMPTCMPPLTFWPTNSIARSSSTRKKPQTSIRTVAA